MKPKLFIGSSVEGLNIAYAVQNNLVHRVEVTVWDQGVFNLSQSALESLVELLERMDFGVFIFTPDDLVTIRGEENRIVRDNVLFELGLFVGRLGRQRSFILKPSQDELRLPTDLLGITPATYETDRSDGNMRAATGPASNEIRENISKLGPHSKGSGIEAGSSNSEEESEVVSVDDEREKVEAAKINDEPTEASAWMRLYLAGEYEKAVERLEKKIEATASAKEVYSLRLRMGEVKSRINLNAGVEYLNKLRETNSEDPAVYLSLDDVYRHYDLTTERIAVLNSGIDNTKEDPSLLTRKASYLLEVGDVDEATQLLTQLIERVPETSSAYIQLARIYQAEKGPEEVKRVYELGRKSLPNNRELLASYGQFLVQINDASAALVVYSKLTELYPKSAQYLTMLGNTYLNFDLSGLALEAYLKANDLAQEKEGWIQANIGNLYKNKGFNSQAIRFLKQALQLAPDFSYAHERLAVAIRKNEEERKKATKIIRNYKRESETNTKS